MRADNYQPEQLAFCQRTALAVIRLKDRLQRKYEQAYPRLRDIIPAIVDQKKKNAWNLSSFPHLLLPDLVEANIAKLGGLFVQKSLKRRSPIPQEASISTGFALAETNVKRVRTSLQGLDLGETDL